MTTTIRFSILPLDTLFKNEKSIRGNSLAAPHSINEPPQRPYQSSLLTICNINKVPKSVVNNNTLFLFNLKEIIQ